MRSKALAAGVAVVAAFLLATNPVVVQAASLITGADIKDDSVTGKDVKESSLKTVPSASKLAPLKSGQTQSGAFSAAGANSTGTSGWLGFDVTYPRPLKTPIANDHIIDTVATPDATHCPGPGEAAPGYLCLYFQYHDGVGNAYGYSEDWPYSETGLSYGVGFYIPVDADQPYANGIWTVTAP